MLRKGFRKSKNQKNVMSNNKEMKIKNEQLKTNKMKTKTKLPYGIKQPTNVEEFRENLKKYYVCLDKDELYVQNGQNQKISKLTSLSDLYEKCEGIPQVTVKLNQLKEFTEYMNETNQIMGCYGYFFDENNYEIIGNQDDFIMNYNPKWIGIDNQIYREFFILTMGDYSGYIENN